MYSMIHTTKRTVLLLSNALLITLCVVSVCHAQKAGGRRAAQGSDSMRVERDLSYLKGASDPLNTLDLYAPKTGDNHPVVIHIHGGGFSIGDKVSGAGVKPQAFTSEGYVFISLNYRLSPAVKFPAHVQDVAKAIAWVQRNVRQYGGDPNTLFVMGHSAGAQLAAMVATDERYLKAEGLNLKNLSGAVLLDGGTYDIATAMKTTAQKVENLTPVFGDDPKVWKEASPLFHVAKGKGIPPFLVIHIASREDSGAQSRVLAKALNDAGVKAEVKPALNKTHATLNKELGQTGDAPTVDVFNFLRGILGSRASKSASR